MAKKDIDSMAEIVEFEIFAPLTAAGYNIQLNGETVTCTEKNLRNRLNEEV